MSVNFFVKFLGMYAFLFFYSYYMKNIGKMLILAERRIKYLIENKVEHYTGHQLYIDAVENELEEAKHEMRKDNKVYLEDELGDVFWWMICLLTSMEKEWLIKKDKVFERAYNKFSERIDYVQSNRDWSEGEKWEEIKKLQKIKRQKEHDDLYNL